MEAKKETKDIFTHWINQRVFIKTNSGQQYTGIVQEVHDAGNGLIFISIIDKFNKWVTITASELEIIQSDINMERGK